MSKIIKNGTSARSTLKIKVPPICPKHKTPLSIDFKTLDIGGTTLQAILGACTKCKTLYTDKTMFSSVSSFTLHGVRYEYLAELTTLSENEYINYINEEHVLNNTGNNVADNIKAEEKNQKQQVIKDDIKKLALEKQQRDLRKSTSPIEAKKKENETFVLIQKKQEKDKQKVERIKNEQKNVASKEQEIENIRRRISSNNYDYYHVKTIVKGRVSIKSCNYDKYPLLFVARVEAHVDNKIIKTSGYCCLKCNSLHIMVMKPFKNVTSLPYKKREKEKHFKDASQHSPIAPKQTSVQEPKGTNDISFDNSSSILYICKGLIACRKKEHNIEAATGIIEDKNRLPIRININYCHQCKQYFIDYTEYCYYRNLYGNILGNFKVSNNGLLAPSYDNLADESTLRLCGYTVNQTDDISPRERYTILSYVIDHKIMSKPEVISYLDFFIRANGKRRNMEVAVSRWSEDVEWVRDYKIDEQWHTTIKDIKKHVR